MLITEPEILAFNNVRLNQAYSSSLCITNSADSSLEFTLRATSPRYSISPNRVRLDAGASAVVTVRLFVSQAHASAGTKADYLVLKCLYSEQRLPVSYTLYKKAPGGRSRSPSPAPSRPSRSPSRTPQAKSEIRPDGSPPAALRFMQSTSSSRGRSPPPSPPPDRHAPQDEQYVPRSEYARVCSAWEDERLMFEQRSEKVMRVLDKKDGLIRDLRAQLAGSGIRGELERQMQAPAEDAAGLDATRAEMAGMRERLIDQSEQIEVLISEIARLRNELTDSVPAAAPAFLAPQIRQDVAPLPASPLPATTDPFPTDALKRRISELEADLYSARFKAEASDREMEELMNRNAYLEGECTALSGQLQRAEETWRQAASEAPLPFPHAATRPDLDTSTSVGPEVLALYQERAHRAETDNGILLGHIAQLEREHAEAEARADVLSRRLGDQQELCAQLSDRCAELETIAEVARPTPKEEPVRQDPEPASRGPDVSVDSDGTELREANVWWSYVWHAMGESDGARLEREHDAAVAVLTASDRNADSQMVGSNSLNYYTDAIARLQRTVNELKSTTSAQVVEIAVARQVCNETFR